MVVNIDMDIKQYYKFPLYCDDNGCYIWTANDKFAFNTFCEEYESNKKIVDILNGASDKVLPNISISKDGEYILCCGKEMLMVRGNGWLTVLGYPEDQRKKIQTAMLEFAADKLSGGRYEDLRIKSAVQ